MSADAWVLFHGKGRTGMVRRRRWLQQASMVATTGAALGIILALLGLGVLLVRDQMRHRSVTGSVATEPSVVQSQALVYEMRAMREDLIVLDVVSRQRIDYGLSSKDLIHALRNQRFVRTGDGVQSTLFAHNKNLIVTVTPIAGAETGEPGRRGTEDREGRAVARLYSVVTTDTDGDGRLTARDDKSLMIAAGDGTRLTTLAQNVGSVSQPSRHLGSGLHLLVADKAGGHRIVRFDLDGWRLLPPLSLPPPAG